MKIKVKLSLSIGLLFLLIVFLGIFSVLRISSMASDTKNILVANDNSLEYARMMLKSLDEIGTEKNALEKFQINLDRQTGNITEIGEQELTESLAEHFRSLKENPQEANVLKK